MVGQLVETLAVWLRKRVAEAVRAAILSGTADGVNAAAKELGMLESPQEADEPPALNIVYVEPDEDRPRKRGR